MTHQAESRVRTHEFNTILFTRKGKDTMKTSESITKATVSLFEAVDLSFLVNPFRASQRRMDEIHEL